MRRIAGAAALTYVVLAAIENMELLGMPGLGAPAADVRPAYADRALAVVTVTAGALSLVAALIALIVVSAGPDAAARTRRAARSPAPRSWPARPTPRPTAPTR